MLKHICETLRCPCTKPRPPTTSPHPRPRPDANEFESVIVCTYDDLVGIYKLAGVWGGGVGTARRSKVTPQTSCSVCTKLEKRREFPAVVRAQTFNMRNIPEPGLDPTIAHLTAERAWPGHSSLSGIVKRLRCRIGGEKLKGKCTQEK